MWGKKKVQSDVAMCATTVLTVCTSAACVYSCRAAIAIVNKKYQQNINIIIITRIPNENMSSRKFKPYCNSVVG